MPDRLEGRLRWLWGGAAVLIATGGGLVLLVAPRVAPSATGAAPDALFATPFASFGWAAAGVATAVALATLIACAPRRYAHLMVVCALGACSAGASLLVAYLAADDAAPSALLAVALALVLAVASLASWLVLWLAPRPGFATRARDEQLLAALLTTLVPSGGETLREALFATFLDAHRRGATMLRVVLRVIDLESRVKHRRGLVALGRDERERLLAGLVRSRSTALRRVGALLEGEVLARYYAEPRVQEEIGYSAAWLRERIAAGPNREAHAAREEAERRAWEEAERHAGDAALAGEPDVAAGAEEGDAPEVTPAVPPVHARRSPAAAAPHGEPLDRAWTLGVSRELRPSPLAPGLQALRSLGPTRP